MKREIKLLKALEPSEGGKATFPEELEILASIMDRTDPGCGLGPHLRDRAERIRSAMQDSD